MQGGERVQDRYVLESRLGRGGMAEVWCAHDERLDRVVAVKFLSVTSDDPENLVRFFSEAQQIARIGHPNVVTVLDFGEEDGRSFIVMENLDGGSIADLAGEPMDPIQAMTYVRAAAAGAGAAHDLGIVHRDIKPDNLLLDEDGGIRLADFGIAAHEGGESFTQTGQAIGSPHYISPEQAQGEKATSASDVYALGIVLYELITGTKPFDSDNVTAVVLAQVERPPASPSTLVEDLDPEIEGVIMTCLAKDPSLRFEDGNALAGALETVIAGGASPSPIGVPPVSGAEDRPVRRKRIALVAAAIVVVAGMAGAAIVFSDQSPEGGDVAIAETPERPTPTRSAQGSDGTPAPNESSPTPTPTPSEEDEAPVEEEEPDDEPKPKPSPTPTPTPTPTPSPTPSPISS